MKTPDYYPVEARVVLKGLVKAPELNGKVGVVKSGLSNGRQHVLIEELSKSVALKVSNLSYEPRTVDSLSIKELKKILKSKAKLADSELTGIDKVELQLKVSNLDEATPESLGQWLAEAAPESYTETAKRATRSDPTDASSVDAAQAADQLANMDPEQLRQQARMMRSMPPDQIRRMNPQLAHMTDAQILTAASQMEMMASNPTMMKMATEQIKNMSPEDIQRAQSQMAAGNGGSASTYRTSSTANGTTGAAGASPHSPAAQASQAAEMMANMTPEQLRQQAEMFESMPPDAIRNMNPQVAHMTDDQIRMAATQFRMMADNPAMMKMAMEQMKSMTPEQLEAIKNGQMPNPAGGVGAGGADAGDPSAMLANMDKTQLKQMLKTMKENPEMLKQFSSQSGLSEEQLAQGVDMFANMDDSKLDMTLNLIQKAQKAKDMWTKVDSKAGGHLLKILLLASVLVISLMVYWLFFKSSGSIVGDGAATSMPKTTTATMGGIPDLNDEFESEF